MNNENVEYLNYWLNKELKNKGTLNISAQEFYQKLITNDIFLDRQRKLVNQIHSIEEQHLKKMNILYDLNAIYYNIKNTSYYNKEKCSLHSDQCVQKFREAIKSCSSTNNDKYCNALNSFKKKYEKFNGNNRIGGCNKEYLLTLPPLEEENERSAIVKTPEADEAKAQQLKAEEENKQHLGDQVNLEKKNQVSTNLIQPSLSPTEESNYDNNINMYTIFGIILSISVFSTITYKVKYITYKNKNI
ncbi:hypothetical protein PVBG_04748 [Plasmodium vivax Brazil I]|uniref:Uncharacterized protein n=1 Tax=Plasmodium vivax (strain Brazil I) TaxID=1033975 RepID=A0A0J9T095_PLAV1|nr:hypothetical protein PVBG_04748 [Plasmodium vivax Brazil I]